MIVHVYIMHPVCWIISIPNERRYNNCQVQFGCRPNASSSQSKNEMIKRNKKCWRNSLNLGSLNTRGLNIIRLSTRSLNTTVWSLNLLLNTTNSIIKCEKPYFKLRSLIFFLLRPWLQLWCELYRKERMRGGTFFTDTSNIHILNRVAIVPI